MTLHDAADLLLRALVLSGASAGVSQLVKYPLQVLLTVLRRYPEAGRTRRLWVGGLRFGATLSGLLLGARLPGLWPEWLPVEWHALIGLCAGISSSAVYDAWLRIVHGAPAAIDAAVRARFGASPAPSEPLAVTDTGTVETDR